LNNEIWEISVFNCVVKLLRYRWILFIAAMAVLVTKMFLLHSQVIAGRPRVCVRHMQVMQNQILNSLNTLLFKIIHRIEVDDPFYVCDSKLFLVHTVDR